MCTHYLYTVCCTFVTCRFIFCTLIIFKLITWPPEITTYQTNLAELNKLKKKQKQNCSLQSTSYRNGKCRDELKFQKYGLLHSHGNWLTGVFNYGVLSCPNVPKQWSVKIMILFLQIYLILFTNFDDGFMVKKKLFFADALIATPIKSCVCFWSRKSNIMMLLLYINILFIF